MNLNRKWALASVLALATAAGIAAVGCGDDSTATPAKDAGGKDSGGGGDIDGSTFDTDSGGGDVDSSMPDLYARLGGRAGIAAAVKETVEGANGELADPQLALYFAIRTGHTGGAPSAAVIEDCFTNFVGKAAGGPAAEVPYPFTSTAGGANFLCRDMATTHAGLGVTNAAFQKFVSIAATKLGMLGVSQADLMTLGGALLGTATDIVDQARTKAQLEAGAMDAATAAQNYGARCQDIWDGGADAQAVPCQQY